MASGCGSLWVRASVRVRVGFGIRGRVRVRVRVRVPKVRVKVTRVRVRVGFRVRVSKLATRKDPALGHRVQGAGSREASAKEGPLLCRTTCHVHVCTVLSLH